MCNYEDFMQGVIGTMFVKERLENSLTEPELRALVLSAFQVAMRMFAKDSNTLLFTLPVDVYEDATYYKVSAPDGYALHKIERVMSNKLVFPNDALVERDTIVLRKCPTKDTTSAWYAEISAIPSSKVCEYPDDYCTYHYDTILAHMLYQLTAQRTQKWFDGQLSANYLVDYEKRVLSARGERVNRLSHRDVKGFMRFMPDVMGMMAGCANSPEETKCLVDEDEMLALVSAAFKSTIIDYATKTRTWRKRVPVSVDSNVRYYPITPPEGFYIHEIERVLSNKAEFPVGSLIDKDGIELALPPAECVENAWMVEISVIPDQSVCDVSDEYFARHHEAILSGILWRLTAHSTRAWFNQELSDRYLGKYNQEVLQAEREITNRSMPKGVLGRVLSILLSEWLEQSIRREPEIINQITIAFHDIVARIARDGRLMKREVPIDVFKGVTHYPVPPIRGYSILSITKVMENSNSLPCGSKVHLDMLTLNCCPQKSIDRAFFVEVSVVPHGQECVHEEDWLDQHYNLIMAGVRWQLHSFLALSAGHTVLKRLFDKAMSKAKRDSLSGKIVQKRGRLSEA